MYLGSGLRAAGKGERGGKRKELFRGVHLEEAGQGCEIPAACAATKTHALRMIENIVCS